MQYNRRKAVLNTDAPWLRHSSVLTPRPSVHIRRLPTCEPVKCKHWSDTKIQRHSKRTKTKTEGPDATLARAHAYFIHHLRVVTDCVMVVSRMSSSVCILIFMFFNSCYVEQNKIPNSERFLLSSPLLNHCARQQAHAVRRSSELCQKAQHVCRWNRLKCTRLLSATL